ncbi:HEAT repeat domain-containing protein [Actinacidiphila glaucinigra]|uniref:HEAT repeat domain-containing protein n=1 Tax=Actinacidiphila glaucinigra TaxID=235986 RepID=UPI0037AB8490
MDLDTVFAGLGRIAWPELHHAYGPADDVPDLLRALAATDEESAEEAEQELWSSLVHQGTVYRATVPAVPFLARLAAAGVRGVELLGMLGAIAESTDEHDPERPGAARAAVIAQLPLLLPLLSDADPEVRQCAAWAVAQCGSGAGADARAALRSRWTVETDPTVRADVLTACAAVDPGAAQEWCAAARRTTEPPQVRVAALLAIVDTGQPWDRDSAAVVAELSPLEPHTAGGQWEREALEYLVTGLHERGDADAAIEVAVSALDRAAEAVRAGAHPKEAAQEATWAAECLALRSRTAPARLLPAMLPLLDHPDTAGGVIDAIRDWDVPVPQSVPPLVRMAEAAGEHADRALAALVRVGAPEAAELLARGIEDRPRALAAAFDRTTQRPPAPLPCTQALLDAVRARLAARTDGAATAGPRKSLVAGGLADVNEPVHLAGLLAGWGPSARAALPELIDALPHHTFTAGRALAAVADARRDPEVVAALRARTGTGSVPDRQAAAAALHTLTGDATALLAVLGPALDEPNGPRDNCLRAVASLGEQARPLLPRLRALLAEPVENRSTVPAAEAALTAATVIWELTGDQDCVLPVVLEGLAWADQPWGDRVTQRAAEVAALVGPAARAAVPRLTAMLDHPDTAAAAVRALVALHPGSDRPAGVPLTELADRVLPALEPGAYLNSALTALKALAALGPTAFTPAQLERMRRLADGERRIVGSGIQIDIIRDDEEFRAAARTVLAGLTP